MLTSTFTYDLDGAMTAAQGEPFSAIRRHKYTRLPIEIASVDSSMALRYDSFGRRLHKIGKQAIFYRSGAHHPAADRTKELQKGNELYHTLVELVGGAEIVYLFTPAGQTILRRKDGYARVARDHLRSVRAERSSAAQITAHYSAYGEALFCGGGLRRAFAGYEPDAETGLYNANRRLYAPQLRLFVSVDPRLQSASPYPYCNDDPFNYIDPTGTISAAAVNGIIAALVLVITIVVTLATDGAAGAAVPVEAAEESSSGFGGMVGSAVLGNDEVLPQLLPETESSAATSQADDALLNAAPKTEQGKAPNMPKTVGRFAKFGAGFGAGSAFASNDVELITKAAHGEHITAWQAVRSMLVEPVIAGAAGAAGGAIASVGLMAANGALALFGMTALGGAAASAIDSVAARAVRGEITKRGAGESIGISMAMAVGEAMVMAPFFANLPGAWAEQLPLGERLKLVLRPPPSEPDVGDFYINDENRHGSLVRPEWRVAPTLYRIHTPYVGPLPED